MPEGWDVPWVEPIGSRLADAGLPERAELTAAFAASLRRTGSLMQLMGQAAADRIGVNATDLNCLILAPIRAPLVRHRMRANSHTVIFPSWVPSSQGALAPSPSNGPSPQQAGTQELWQSGVLTSNNRITIW